jgi:predicted dehydrogenase
MSKIKFAVVGAGHIGKRHAEMIRRDAEGELVALVDPRGAEACDALAFGVPFFNDINDLLASNLAFDVVNVCTPNGLHAEQALLALEAKKHVVCEKPMGLTTKSCEGLIYKALQVSRQVFCVMQNRYSPPSVWIKDLLESGKLGKIFMVNINCYWNRDDRYYKKNHWKVTKDLDGGTLFTQFSHFLDIMYWLFGDIMNIQSKMTDFNHGHSTDFEDSGMVNFDFINGGMGSFNFSTSCFDQNYESSMTIIAENGTIKIGGQYMNEVVYCHVKDYEMPELPEGNPANDYGHYKGSAANHVYIIENVIATLQGNSIITTNALEGMKVVDIIERMYAAVK